MRWQGRRESQNVEDRRTSQAGFGIPIPLGRGGLGIGGLVVLLILGWILGIDPLTLLSGGDVMEQSEQSTEPEPAESAELKKFAGVVLADTEDVWTEMFSARGETYETPKLVLFSGGIRTACGAATQYVCQPNQP